MYLLFVLFSCLLLFGVLVWCLGVQSQTPRRLKLRQHPKLPVEPIQFVSNGATLHGWHIPGKCGPGTPLVLLAHGWGTNRSHMLRYVEPLHQAGYSLLLYDARSHGESDAAPVTSILTFRDDLMAAIRYARQRPEINPRRIGVIAHSFGAFAAILASSRRLDLDAVVTDSMPASFSSMTKAELRRFKLPAFPLAHLIPLVWMLRAGIPPWRRQQFRLDRLLQRNEPPLLMVHSRKDDYIPPGDLTGLLSRLPAPPAHLYVETEGHNASERDPRFWTEVLPFLETHLHPSRTPSAHSDDMPA